jgi:hypothetical protein
MLSLDVHLGMAFCGQRGGLMSTTQIEPDQELLSQAAVRRGHAPSTSAPRPRRKSPGGTTFRPAVSSDPKRTPLCWLAAPAQAPMARNMAAAATSVTEK